MQIQIYFITSPECSRALFFYFQFNAQLKIKPAAEAVCTIQDSWGGLYVLQNAPASPGISNDSRRRVGGFRLPKICPAYKPVTISCHDKPMICR